MDGYVLTIDGPPMRKNQKHRVFANRGRVGRTLTPEYKRFCERVALAWDKAQAELETLPIKAGFWILFLDVYWPRQRHLDVSVPIGDVDASVECCLDALQHTEEYGADSDALDDDARVTRAVLTEEYDKHNPRTVIELRPAEAFENAIQDLRAKRA